MTAKLQNYQFGGMKQGASVRRKPEEVQATIYSVNVCRDQLAPSQSSPGIVEQKILSAENIKIILVYMYMFIW